MGLDYIFNRHLWSPDEESLWLSLKQHYLVDICGKWNVLEGNYGMDWYTADRDVHVPLMTDGNSIDDPSVSIRSAFYDN